MDTLKRENHVWPPALLCDNEVKTTNKADFEPIEKLDDQPEVACRIIDGAAAVQSLDPVKIFEEYAD